MRDVISNDFIIVITSHKCKKTAVYKHTVNGDGSTTAKIIKRQC